LAALVRGELSKLARGVLCALITIDVHARDIITEMVKRKVVLHSSVLFPRVVNTTLMILRSFIHQVTAEVLK